MIGYIRGVVTAIFEDSCFVETGGIGYRVYISGRDAARLETGKEARFVTYLVVREDALTLYGFLTEEAYDVFLLLLSVSKIGPKVALGVLSALGPAEFRLAVGRQDLSALTKLPGIGKKTAERLLLELKDKVGAADGGAAVSPLLPKADGAAEEALAALCSLGYRPEEVRPVVARLAERESRTEELIRQALREMGK